MSKQSRPDPSDAKLKDLKKVLEASHKAAVAELEKGDGDNLC